MKKLKAMPLNIPHFKTYEQEAEFWATHDTSTLLKNARPVAVSFLRPIKHLISIRMDSTLISGLRTLAAKRHMPYQTLIRTLLAEKLEEIHRKTA